MSKKKIIIFVMTILAAVSYGFEQDVGLARSSPNYMVTPGDVYTLTFAVGGNLISHTLVVGTDYRIRVANLGIVNGRGQTFIQVRNQVETIVANNHPLSGPQLILTQPAVFRVFVNGEVYAAGERSAWGLTRLSTLVDDNLTELASIRNVTVRSSNQQTRVFDLFQFWRFGDQSQNPYLRPGDVITFNRVNRLVTIQGEVERSGTYQLLAGENLRDLVRLYGNGLTPLADLSRITLTRFVGSGEISGDIILLSEEDIDGNFALEHLDIISIPNITDFRPAVPVERIERTITIYGAVRRPGTFELMQHENLRTLVEVYGDGLTPLADLGRITLTRFVGSEEISGDIILLSGEDIVGDFSLEHMDIVSIPSITDFRPAVPVERVERTITISGAVRRYGTFELMLHENLRELIEIYGDGLTPLADPTRIEVVRRVNSEDVSGNMLFLTLDDLQGNFALEHLDLIHIPTIGDLQPVVFVEGAVGIDITADLVTTNRLTVRFHTGETYAAMVRRNREWFSAVSDTENAYVIRQNGEIVPLNLNLALFDATYRGEVLVQDEDTLIIPFRQFFVTVAGPVVNPGRFPFIPDRGWEYYVALAGGFIPGRNVRSSVVIVDSAGRRLRPGDAITPETVITARANHPMFFLGQYIVPVLSVISTMITVMLLVR